MENAFWLIGLAFVITSLINIIGIIYIKTKVNPTKEQIQRKLDKRWKKRNSRRNF